MHCAETGGGGGGFGTKNLFVNSRSPTMNLTREAVERVRNATCCSQYSASKSIAKHAYILGTVPEQHARDCPRVFRERIDQRNRPIESPCFTQRSIKHLQTHRQSKRAWRSNSLLEDVAGLHLPNRWSSLRTCLMRSQWPGRCTSGFESGQSTYKTMDSKEQSR